jgi:hypothetical protein
VLASNAGCAAEAITIPPPTGAAKAVASVAIGMPGNPPVSQSLLDLSSSVKLADVDALDSLLSNVETGDLPFTAIATRRCPFTDREANGTSSVLVQGALPVGT